MQTRRLELTISLFLFSGLVGAYLVYSPGIDGPFIFDDYNNLRLLGVFGGVDSWQSLFQYISSGIAGPTGRPISLITFLLDANNWPASPHPFKYTNILIHLLNGLLVFWATLAVLRQVSDDSGKNAKLYCIALFSSFFWLFHPYFVSTNLYVVQRMAQLPLLFTLISIIVYIKYRALVGVRSRLSYITVSISLPVLALLAAFSKENGALLPVLILVVEYTVFGRANNNQALNKYWKFIFLQFPLFFVIGYLLYLATSNGWSQPFPIREFSPLERLLTEFRIVWIYIYHLFVPHLYTTGVFHDTLKFSAGLLSPVSTVVGLIATVSVIILGVKLRFKAPLIALSILFFFASQLIESTTVGLELMFEHRVYLGSIFLFLPVVFYLANILSARPFYILCSLIVLLLASFCWYGATLWSSYPTMTLVWASKMPESPRAQVEAARMLYDAGQRNESLHLLEQAVARIHDDLFLSTTHLLVKCRVKSASKVDRKQVLDLARSNLYRPTYFNLLQKVESWSTRDDCSGLDAEFVIDYIDGLLSQDRVRDKRSQAYAQLQYVKGVALLKAGEVDAASKSFERSLSSRVDPQKLMNIAAFLAGQGLYRKALVYSVEARELVLSGSLRGRKLAEAPRLSDIEYFIKKVKREMPSDE